MCLSWLWGGKEEETRKMGNIKGKRWIRVEGIILGNVPPTIFFYSFFYIIIKKHKEKSIPRNYYLGCAGRSINVNIRH